MKISESMEDYLQSIYQIQMDNEYARVKDIAEDLDVKTSSVISALKKLSEGKLVYYQKYGYIKLTKNGLLVAAEIYEKKNSVSSFLSEVMCINKRESRKLAHGLEHHLNEKLLTRMEALTLYFRKNKVKFCDVKTFLKKYEKEFENTVDKFKTGANIKILRIKGHKEIKERLFSMGIIPGVTFKIERKTLNEPVEIFINNVRIILRDEEIKSIVGEKV
ncbi:MAG: DtxR family transcriptional regulator, Mn-dependent transcriptional regulator [Kosmotogales bacterium]|nr:DtxR family transcriptional regulator, Mn-dependent transcriptional regulator [Kosmotogales bacterium]